MSNLKVSTIKNPNATTNNITLHANGSIGVSNSVIIGGSLTYDSTTANTIGANSINCNTATINTDLNIGAITGFPFFSGMTVQTILNRVDTRTSYTTVGQEILLAALDTNITPKFASSIILCEFQICGESNQSSQSGFRVYKNNSKVTTAGYESYNNSAGAGDVKYSIIAPYAFDNNNSTTPAVITFMYYDAPSVTTQVTYTPVFVRTLSTAENTFYLNRTVNSNGAYDNEVGVSFVKLTEIYQTG